ncbi:DUF3592 domain-containing protein [Tolypothrix sp. FACHB-123]|uniref:DUF3592 domain-containing protein n=1 Tax=Tolypothrix sp. FACHB-123 TaxID=2692868 RepID=UPI001689D34D|nr:DUF3592 domain-containing protein [Tolypothrix sp. FACHB-123]MBD2355591.1 DUF3592 domain-containing protein [Tolypothrix sp. FACHB-123]
MSKVTKFIGSVMAGMGTLFTVIGVVNGLDTRSFVNSSIQTQGTVIDVVRRSSRDSDGDISYAYYPVIKFTPASGEETIFESTTGTNPPSYSRGQSINILYNPQQPNSARENSWFTLWGFPAIFTGIGSIFVVIGGALFLVKLPVQQQVNFDFDAHFHDDSFGKDF